MPWAVLGFVAITGLSVWLHVRSRRDRGPAAVARVHCPRCKAPVTNGALACPGCRAPLQAFDLVQAPVVEAGPAAAGGVAHAMVRADLCVGCGTCVDACPHPGAIAIVNKVATVDLGHCEGAGSCAKACPVGALVVGTGEAVQHVEVPLLDVHFESNVPGLYVVGELGGRGLIKNAINEGKLAIEHVAATLPKARPEDGDPWDVVIVGSGPAGLSAALEAHRRGLRYLVLEQGTPSDTIRKYPRKKLLFAEPIRVPLYGDLWIADGSKESLLAVWENLIASTGLRLETGVRVDRVQREGDWLLVGAGDEAWLARRVVLAMGRRGTPRRLGVPGESLDKVFYDIVEMEQFAGSRVLVVGGGDSAIESALGLANQKDTPVALSYRGTDFSRAKERNRQKLDAAVAAKKVEPMLGSEVREIRPDVVALVWRGRPHLMPNDVVVVRIGGEAPYPFLERCGIRIVHKAVALDPAPEAAAAAR
jgi:thioredoxin reductase/NAD-dependent dihydropyrimidine dehydrogenase PreA subunit